MRLPKNLFISKDMEKQWYVFRTRQSYLPKVKGILESSGVEYFIPYRKEKIRESNGDITERFCPLVLNYVFVKCIIKEFDCGIFPFPVYPCYDSATRDLMVVPLDKMNDFMFIYDFSEKAMLLDNSNLKHGDRVRVVKGEFAGVVGELIRINGHKRVVVRLDGLFSLAVNTYLPKSFLERLD